MQIEGGKYEKKRKKRKGGWISRKGKLKER
jgi:hypothetical protein